MFLTYPLVIPIPGQIAFSAVVVSNLLITPSCERKRERGREGGGGREKVTLPLKNSTGRADYTTSVLY